MGPTIRKVPDPLGHVWKMVTTTFEVSRYRLDLNGLKRSLRKADELIVGLRGRGANSRGVIRRIMAAAVSLSGRRGASYNHLPGARSPTVRFSAIPKPLADARGSDRSRDREGAVHGNSTISHGRRPSCEHAEQDGTSTAAQMSFLSNWRDLAR
jgi:hypothetical protein